MNAIDVSGFPRFAAFPKAKKSKCEKFWEAWDLVKRKGTILPFNFCAKLAGVSRTRIDELVAKGKLERVLLDEHWFITEESLVAWMKSEDKGGRRRRGWSVDTRGLPERVGMATGLALRKK